MKHFVWIFALLTTVANADTHRVALPTDYRESFEEYIALDRIQNPDQFIRLFANEVAMQGRNENGELAEGSIIVAEVYSVLKNEDGSVKTTLLNRRVKDKLKLLAVMEKRKAFSDNPVSTIKTGDWDFGAYKPNGEVAPKNLDQCRACHMPLTETDFLFSIEHLPSFSM